MSTPAPMRKQVPVTTAGDFGASHAVWEKNWVCPACKNENFATRDRCFRCRNAKPAGGGVVVDGPAGAFEAGHKWREAFDPSSQQIYYFNTETHETSWDRPAVMGPAPHATGYYGRGRAGETSKSWEDKIAAYMKRPARKQSNFLDSTKSTRVEGTQEYNIWYDKWIGTHWSEGASRDPAETRCSMSTDAGWTRADAMKERQAFCLHFARGSCSKGHECNFYHRAPSREDDALCDPMKDIFSRDRHAQHRDDMGGVGSFSENSRTLYIGGLPRKEGGDMEGKLRRQFGEWGEVENVNMIHRLSIAFVRYRFRVQAEFAKEAMSNQSVIEDEVVNVRWAYDDPNPVAIDSGKRADHDAILAAVAAKGLDTSSAAYQYPSDYVLPPEKRLKVDGEASEESSVAAGSYPDTDGQFGAAVSTPGAVPPEYTPWAVQYQAWSSALKSRAETRGQPAPDPSAIASAQIKAGVIPTFMQYCGPFPAPPAIRSMKMPEEEAVSVLKPAGETEEGAKLTGVKRKTPS